MYIFKLKLSEKARGYCMYAFLVGNMNLKFLGGSRHDQQVESIEDVDSPSARTTQAKCSEERLVWGY